MIIEEIVYRDPVFYFSRFSENNWALLLHSASFDEKTGRYSFIALDPFATILCKEGLLCFQGVMSHRNPFDLLNELIQNYPLEKQEGYPPFQGGLAGYLSYDLGRVIEKIPKHKIDDMGFPDMALGVYDQVISFDHKEKKAWIFSSGYPEKEKKAREKRARVKIKKLLGQLSKNFFRENNKNFILESENIISNFDKKSYLQAVEKTKNYILEGDIFQANISQCFSSDLPYGFSKFNLYQRLMELNPSPFSAYFHHDDICLISASPERFLRQSSLGVETRPIKGTRPRGKTKKEDEAFSKELLFSEKDKAENVMIVDLMRNDLSRVCEDHHVKVSQLCELETFETVHHLVSAIEGKLKTECNQIKLIQAIFPGGSVTGAPKIRSMGIIAEIEPTQRGPYCGCMGYIGFNDEMDLSITIRTFCIKKNKISFQAGGAIVLDSDPLIEYEETWHKAKVLHESLL